MVIHHEIAMPKFDGGRVDPLKHPQNELCLPPVHIGVKPSWEHPEGIDVLFGLDIFYKPQACT